MMMTRFSKAGYQTPAQEYAALKRAREQKPLPPSPAVQQTKQDSSSDDGSFLMGYATGIPLGKNGLLGAVAGGHFSSSSSSDDRSDDSSFSGTSSSSDSSSSYGSE